MEYLPEHVYLKFHADTLECVRKSFNLDKPGEMDNAIDILDEWIKQQNHFNKKDFDRSHLERIIIASKGSLQRAKKRMDNLCTARTLMPQYFGVFDIRKDFGQYIDKLNFAVLPKLTEDHYRICICRCWIQETEPIMIRDCFRSMFMALDYFRAHDYCIGYILILDVFQINWSEILKVINITQIKEGLSIVLAGYDSRLKGCHILSKSKLVEVAVNIFKQILNAKVAGRIQIHKTIECLNENVPKETLPLEYGGKEESLEILYDKIIDIISSDENKKFMEDMYKARTDESLRPKDHYSDVYDAGMQGTFRSLNVD